ncbi:hypothetical protein ACEE21_15500 [Clostridium baratii]
MFGDFSDKDFALVLMSVENYNKSCSDLVKMAEDKEIPLYLVSSLTNVQRIEYDLPVVKHTHFRDLLLDTVISGNKYFFNSENLKLSLATLVTVYDGSVKDVCRIMKEVKKFLSFKINYNYEISEYVKTLACFK